MILNRMKNNGEISVKKSTFNGLIIGLIAIVSRIAMRFLQDLTHQT